MIAVLLIAAIYAVAFCVFPGFNSELGCHIAPLAFLTGLFWGAVIIVVASLIAHLVIRDRGPD